LLAQFSQYVRLLVRGGYLAFQILEAQIIIVLASSF
jgi:hypothetical protein